jgi:hypothetical protein
MLSKVVSAEKEIVSVSPHSSSMPRQAYIAGLNVMTGR